VHDELVLPLAHLALLRLLPLLQFRGVGLSVLQQAHHRAQRDLAVALVNGKQRQRLDDKRGVITVHHENGEGNIDSSHPRRGMQSQSDMHILNTDSCLSLNERYTTQHR
jgi:hypothetical protein